MDTPIKEIIGAESERELRSEFTDLLCTENCTFDQVEDLLLGYGLEMDFLEQLIY